MKKKVKITIEFEADHADRQYLARRLAMLIKNEGWADSPTVEATIGEMPIAEGMGATQIVGSDRYPYTVIQVVSDKKLILRSDSYRRIDKNGFSEGQKYEYTPDPDGRIVTVTLRRNGRWVVEGESMRGGSGYHIGDRRAYQDPSF